MADFEQVEKGATDAVKLALRNAYEAGVAAGYAKASEEIRARLSNVFSEVVFPSGSVITNATVNPDQRGEEMREAPGTVKPTLLKLVTDSPQGISTKELIARTGFRANTTRGTLWSLRTQEKQIHKVGNKWFPGPESESAESTEQKGTPEGAPDRFAGRMAVLPNME
jgi:hypothetical protein